jgi:hypothetical protein
MGLFSLLFLVLEECIETFLKGFPGSGIAFRRICEFFGGVEEVHKILAMLSVLDFLVELLTQVNAMVFWSPLLRGGLGQAMVFWSSLLRGGLSQAMVFWSSLLRGGLSQAMVFWKSLLRGGLSQAMVFWSSLLRGGLGQAMVSNLIKGGLGLKVDSGGGKGGECANNRFVHFDNSLLSFAGFKLYKSPDLMSKRKEESR